MEGLMAIAVGLLFAAAFYMMLRRSIVKLVMGLIILSNAANLSIFAVAGMTRGAPPFLDELSKNAATPVADPLPQALILTAIVIAFGVLAFSVVLIHRVYKVVGSDDLDQMKGTDT
ncbi:MAG: Na+/H+ antiporter subunit C [Acidiferrobacterales bacterium]|nr:Na+/H+ antiporter subunit C [Acidiferrobacterales bacterium]